MLKKIFFLAVGVVSIHLSGKASANDFICIEDDGGGLLCQRDLGFFNGIKVGTVEPRLMDDGAYQDLIILINNIFRGNTDRIGWAVDRYYLYINSGRNNAPLEGRHTAHSDVVMQIIQSIQALDDHQVRTFHNMTDNHYHGGL